MGRPKRIWIPHMFYHIVCRGNRRDPLFRDGNDFIAILYMFEKVYEKIPYELVSYCLMTNHFHLLLRSQEEPISKVMALVNKRYANYYNTKYKLTGHVFEKRYFSEMVKDTTGMLTVSRYIHLNPIKAKMVKSPEHYPWSSFRFYANPHVIPPNYIDTTYLLNYFPGTETEKREQFVRFSTSDTARPGICMITS
ncbi:transposase [Anaerobacillus alkalidiazotrophicus]|uniref:Transposase n=1 Tax=Anaerobacillus alkalidiazotrophicus TaxID=472963 RepID=A0A1S2MAW8_9BACI|nr:transposase [Anaerobacillus alkalidiazotrophicus]OIJ21714.1 transposase [Anaerobacillus alkalidiazotrophicus]